MRYAVVVCLRPKEVTPVAKIVMPRPVMGDYVFDVKIYGQPRGDAPYFFIGLCTESTLEGAKARVSREVAIANKQSPKRKWEVFG